MLAQSVLSIASQNFMEKTKKIKLSKLLGMFNWDTIWEISYSLGMVEWVGIIFIFG